MERLTTILIGIVMAVINTGILFLFAIVASFLSGGGTGPPPSSFRFQDIFYILVMVTAPIGVIAGWVCALQQQPSRYWKMAVLIAYTMIGVMFLVG